MLTFAIPPEALSDLVEQLASAVAAKLQAEAHANKGPKVPAERLALTPAEAAIALGISPRLLWDLTKSGQIHATKAGSRVVYARAELLSFLAVPGKDLGT